MNCILATDNPATGKRAMSADMLECMVKCNEPILTASDAHSSQNVGLSINEMNALAKVV